MESRSGPRLAAPHEPDEENDDEPDADTRQGPDRGLALCHSDRGAHYDGQCEKGAAGGAARAA